MTLPSQPIAILDSGVGGLSIFRAVAKTLPHLSMIYGCDNLHFPYGPKAPKAVIQSITQLALKVVQRFHPKLIVIACNTASTVALEALRQEPLLKNTPIVGVVPAIKPAALKSLTRTLGLLATPGTVQSPYTSELIAHHAQGCQILKIGSSLMVEWAEQKLRGKTLDLSPIARELAPFFPQGAHSPIDTIVLGCTHFPLLLEELILATPKPIQWIDSTDAIAKRVVELLPHLPPTLQDPQHLAVFTRFDDTARSLQTFLHSLSIFHSEGI